MPSLWFFHEFVREHTAVPADMADLFGHFAFRVAKPVTCVPRHIELAVGICYGAMLSSLLMIARAFDGCVVLCDVEIDGPGAQGVGHFFHGRVEG